MSRQARFLREGVEDQLILEQAKGSEGLSREQLESRIVVPHHTIFLQIFPLYILPVIVIVIGYFSLIAGLFVSAELSGLPRCETAGLISNAVRR